jgi:hypothetical protein
MENLEFKNKTENTNVELVIKLRKEKKSYSEIKSLTNMSISQISKICKKFGLVNNRYMGEISDELKSLIIKTYEETNSVRQTSKILKVTRDTVNKYVKINRKKSDLSRDQQLSKNVIEWRKRKKIELVDYKGGCCQLCGYDRCIEALEFHHNDPNEKDFTISGKSWSFERLKVEADKCILVCSNCHKEIHSKQR